MPIRTVAGEAGVRHLQSVITQRTAAITQWQRTESGNGPRTLGYR